jgi:uncharacterized protein (DUF1800 family)
MRYQTKPNRGLLFKALLCAASMSALTTAAHAQTNQVGFWWKSNEPGWGLSVQQQGTSTFAVWYTYNAQAKPTWYTLSCTFNGSTCTGDLYTASGKPFYQITAGADQTATKEGSGTLTLNGNNMNLSYTIGSVTQIKSNLERFNISSSVPTCTLQSAPRVTATNYTDLWWGGANAAGWGLQVTHQGDQVFAGWYAYGENREAAWITASGIRDAANPKRFTGQLYQVPTGTAFTQPFAATGPKADTIGTFELSFSDGEKGTFRYILPTQLPAGRSLAIERFAIAGGATNLCSVQTAIAASAKDSRFLSQATFGPSRADLEELTQAGGQEAWLNKQFSKNQTRYLPPTAAYVFSLPKEDQRGQTGFQWALWNVMSTADDQLRQRMAYALSQIFVVSIDSNSVAFPNPRGVANYMDMLGENAFGNYRNLLESVTYSPMMGIYLSSMRNRKENPVTGSVPDENYAREIMQLFSIGLYELNQDGSQKLDSKDKPIETYTNADITGLAKIFTGLSWAGPDASDTRFYRANGVPGTADDPDREIKPMQAYNNFHSLAEKRFLGVTIPAQTSATVNTNADIKIALDTLFNHPNVGPFIGKQLIQRLVMSNPSPTYVSRVSAAFNNNGNGVRGDMKAVIRAVLLDPEARAGNLSAQSGKLREPAVRFIQWMRAFNASSKDGRFLLGNLSNPSTQLAQTPMRAPSVFNFYRPGYIPPNSNTGTAGLVAPEIQITTETSVAGYLNYIRTVVNNGAGGPAGVIDITANYSYELSLADNADRLVDHINLLLSGNSLSTTTRNLIRDAVAAIPLTGTTIEANKRNRVTLAIYLVMASPEYIQQN